MVQAFTPKGKTALNKMAQVLKVLIVGTGRMAAQHAQRYAEIDSVQVIAAVDTDLLRVQTFCRHHKIEHAYQDLDVALSKHHFDACSVVTPDAYHAPVSIRVLQAGIAVLCEKPLSDSVDSAQAMVDAAAGSGQTTMVNLSYRSSGALARARELVDATELGQIRHVEASYRQSWLATDYWGDWKTEDAWLWRLSSKHGSMGVLGDIGIHILDFLCAGVGQDISGLQCRLQTFDKAPGNAINGYDLDANDSCVMNVQLANGVIGVVHMSRYYTGYMNDLFLSVHGTLGAVMVSTGQTGDSLQVSIGKDMHSQTWKTVEVTAQPDTFERFINAVRSGSTASPDFAHAANLQHYLNLGFESHDTGQWRDCQASRK